MRISHALLAAGLFAAGVAVSAENDPQAMYDYRHNTFEALGKHMKLAGMVVKGEITRPKVDMVAHAKGIHEISKTIPGIFPKGTGPDVIAETEALPEIWADWKGFEAAADRLQTESAKLIEIAEAGDVEGYKSQYKKVGAACGGCHKKFRKDDE